MSTTLTKRQFLKLMGGLSLGLLPLVGCYQPSKPKEKDSAMPPKDAEPAQRSKFGEISDKDVVMLTKNDELYTKFKNGYNKRIDKTPRKIAVCYTELGIQYAISVAKEDNLKIAIRSGGHSFEGFSSNDDGMVINLSNMKKISWEKDQTILIEPGCTIADLHKEVFSRGRLVPAGSCGGVAMGGLTLGGGYGLFSRKYGLSCDSMLDARVVLANEEAVQASEKDRLLWALRGGGNGNFGVISQFSFKTYPLPNTFSAYTLKFRNLDEERFQLLIATFFSQTKLLAPEAFGAFVLNGSTLTILLTTHSGANITNTIQPLVALADSSSQSLEKPTTEAMKRYYGRKEPLFFKNSSAGYYKDYNDIAAISASIFQKVVACRGMIYQINTLGGAINKYDANQSCYPHRNKNYLAELQGYYDTNADTARIEKSFEEIQRIVLNAGIKAQYRNYPDINFQNWANAYYGENYPTLQKIKKQLDPENIFSYPQSIKV